MEDDEEEDKWLLTDPNDCTTLYNVPLWRVQWIELPGYQNILNVHVPHYTHMFRKLIYETPEPWLYGHIYLPDGSENLNNPNYFLKPNKNVNNVTYVGTLMRITDYVEEEDGRLTLFVQALERMKVVDDAKQHVPYAIASQIRIQPDLELWEFYTALLVNNMVMEYDMSMAMIEASRALAVKEAEVWRDFEYRGNRDLLQATGTNFLSPLSNANATAAPILTEMKEEMKEELIDSFQKRLIKEAEEKGIDEILIATSSSSGLTKELKDILSNKNKYPMRDILEKEKELWCELDQLLKIIGKAQNKKSMEDSGLLPREILGLLPSDMEWEEGFQLLEWAQKAEAKELENAKERAVATEIGLTNPTVESVLGPFVRCDKTCAQWPTLRRASRLSYYVWFLLDIITIGGNSVVGGEYRLNVLKISRIDERLDMAIRQLKYLTKVIQESIDKRKN